MLFLFMSAPTSMRRTLTLTMSLHLPGGGGAVLLLTMAGGSQFRSCSSRNLSLTSGTGSRLCCQASALGRDVAPLDETQSQHAGLDAAARPCHAGMLCDCGGPQCSNMQSWKHRCRCVTCT